MDGYTLGREIVDAFHAFYSQTGEEWTGFKSQIRGLDADRVLATGEVCDIYFHEYDITGKMRKADGM